jgi:hypothetical protein
MLKQILLFMTLKWLLMLQCVLFTVLNVLDAHSTWQVLKPNNYNRERNPIARWVFRKLRLPNAIIFFKALLLSLLSIVIVNWWNDSLTINIALLIGNLLFIFVVLHNYIVAKHYRGINRKIKYIVTSEQDDL